MSAFHRFLFSTFLFLALTCFAASAAFAITYTYWAAPGYTQCNLSLPALCSSAYGSYKTTNNDCTTSSVECKEEYQGNLILKNTCKGKDPWGNYTGQTYSEIESYSNVTYYSKQTHTCPSGETFKLTGCTAECIPDPCKALKDQEETALVSCGTVTCPDGATIVASGSSAYCSNGKKAVGAVSPAPIATINGCSAALKPLISPITSVKVKSSATGSSTEAYCSATYKHQGVSTPQIDVPPNLVPLTFTGADYPDANGDCSDPTKPIKSTLNGQTVCYPNDGGGNGCPVAGEKPNANGVCVSPDDPTYPDDDTTDPKPETGCPSGQIRNNSGVCVPYADATKCPVGQVRDNLGTCSPDPKANSCPVGQVKNVTTGLCSNDPRGTGCAGGSLPDKSGMCPDGKASCPIGKTRDSSGMCVGNNSNDPPDGTGCKDGSTADALGKCADGSGVCPSGQIRNSLGKCVVDDVNTPKSATASNDCLVSPECSGDIVQCGLIQQNWQTGCDLQKALTGMPDGLSDKLAKIGTSSNDSRIGAASGSAENALTQLSQKIGFSNSACPTDISIQVLSKSIVIPISQVCDLLKIIRLLLHLATYFFCLRMLWTTLVTI